MPFPVTVFVLFFFFFGFSIMGVVILNGQNRKFADVMCTRIRIDLLGLRESWEFTWVRTELECTSSLGLISDIAVCSVSRSITAALRYTSVVLFFRPSGWINFTIKFDINAGEMRWCIAELYEQIMQLCERIGKVVEDWNRGRFLGSNTMIGSFSSSVRNLALSDNSA